MISTGDSLKQFLLEQHAQIADAHRHGAPGFVTCAALTSAMDHVVRAAYGSLPPQSPDGIAVFALGGYGRGELCPYSDVDLMILSRPGLTREAPGDRAKALLHLLWDAGITVGHSVRTIDEALETRTSSIESWAATLEHRFLCGNEKIAGDFLAAMRSVIGPEENTSFIDRVLEDTRSRHLRYGNSVKLLEPNVKKSAGGLRDMHAVLWLYRANDIFFLSSSSSSGSMTSSLLDALTVQSMVSPEECNAAKAAYEFLLRTRHAMHYRREAAHDTLEYALQREVAEDLGFGSKAELRSVEVFMREYYLHARVLYRLHHRLVSGLVEAHRTHDERQSPGETVGDAFLLHDDILSLADKRDRFDSRLLIFEAFAHAAELDAEMDARLLGAIERSVDLITEDVCADKAIGLLFQRIIRSKRVAKTLSEMNDLGVLGRYIPEFGDLVAFFQHNMYHYFTADEHTLVALANAERLRDQQGVLREVFRNLKRKDVLFMAILLHDIGKPKGVADHEVTGVEMAGRILERVGMQEIFPDVGFLIRNHLVMEQVAFRRNIHDPETIKEFAARFSRPEQLDYLYLLTYADLSAVNVNVWTEWKASMLQDLYMRTSEVLRRNLKGVEVDRFHQARKEVMEEAIVEYLSAQLPREKVERHLGGIQGEGYTALFTNDEIARHIEKAGTATSASAMFAHSEGFTEVTVIARDAPFALSKFCAVLAANDASILDANIFTRDDGVIIDRFRVIDAGSKRQLEERVCRKIADDVSNVMSGALDLRHLFEAHHRRWKRRPKAPLNPHVRIDVAFEDNPRFTIVDVYAPDSVGFLYRVTETISRLALDIYFAKIATRVDGIVDAFYVLDRTGKPIQDAAWRETIRTEILKTIRILQEEQLGESS